MLLSGYKNFERGLCGEGFKLSRLLSNGVCNGEGSVSFQRPQCKFRAVLVYFLAFNVQQVILQGSRQCRILGLDVSITALDGPRQASYSAHGSPVRDIRYIKQMTIHGTQDRSRKDIVNLQLGSLGT